MEKEPFGEEAVKEAVKRKSRTVLAVVFTKKVPETLIVVVDKVLLTVPANCGWFTEFNLGVTPKNPVKVTEPFNI